jgi:hypothetical protein
MAGKLGAHDLGGVPDDAPIDRNDKVYHLWEQQVWAQWVGWVRLQWQDHNEGERCVHGQVHALQLALVRKGLLSVDEMRRGIEVLAPEQQEVRTRQCGTAQHHRCIAMPPS